MKLTCAVYSAVENVDSLNSGREDGVLREKKRDEIKSDCLFTFFFFFLFDGPVDGWIVFASYEFILSNFFSPHRAFRCSVLFEIQVDRSSATGNL